ncbi:MAG TPA: ABC transporter permease, partial [Ilumatobacteraceae bacterium]|nr:ABC transporter permease [Ilumatobacteraceae bacterium]
MHLRQVQTTAGIDDSSFSFAEVADYRAQAKTIDQFVEFGDWTFNVLGRGEPHRATGGLVTANFFPMLGAHAQLGRLLLQSDEGKTAAPVVVLTYAYWQRVFGADPSVVGQMLDLTVKKAQIVGVLAPGSHYATQRKQDFYVNYAANDHYVGASMQNEREHRMTDVYARLAPGQTAAAAQAELREVARRLHASYSGAYPAAQGFDTVVTPWKDELTAKAWPTLMILMVTTVFVLVIACANVANLTLTRLVQREREMAIRAALGAGGSVLRRLLLAENLVLSVLGGALGLVLAVSGLDLLIAYAGRFTTRTGEIELDGWVLGFTLVVSIAMALVFAWAPRLTFVSDPVRAMAGAGGRATGSTGRRRAQRILVVSQLAASFMLLIGAGLLTRTLLRLYAIDPGFNLANVLSLQAPDFSVPNRDRRVQFSRDVLERLRTEPAVQGAALASAAPLVGSFPFQQQIRVDGGDPDAAGSTPRTTTRIVSTGYFETIGARIKEGRSFQATDGANSARVVILSESMARFYFKNHEAVGRHISWKQFNGNWTQPAEIVGVAADNRSDGITETPLHTLYQLDTQSTPVSTLLLRTADSPGSLTPHVI